MHEITVFMELFPMLAKTFYGLEEILAQELRNLGAQKVQTGVRSVQFLGDKGFMYKANLACRTAIRILKPVYEFPMRKELDLYHGIQKIEWLPIIQPHQTFMVQVTEHQSIFKNTQFVALKAKDAIVDQIREKTGERPNIDKEFPDVTVHVHIDAQKCSVSLDSSGASLHQRGYRTQTNIAPINEILAAGILLLSGWNGQSNFLDPMCGSGTFLIEAAMIACNIPANLNRKEFAFERWNDWEPDLFELVLESLMKKTRDFQYQIIGFDKAPSAVRKASENVEHAKLEDYITVSHEDFFSTKKETEGPLHMVFNPPYGERLQIDANDFYSKIGTTLKHGYPCTKAWMISSHLEGLKFVGLKPSKKIKLFNGKLEAKLVCYEMYEGSKKQSIYLED